MNLKKKHVMPRTGSDYLVRVRNRQNTFNIEEMKQQCITLCLFGYSGTKISLFLSFSYTHTHSLVLGNPVPRVP